MIPSPYSVPGILTLHFADNAQPISQIVAASPHSGRHYTEHFLSRVSCTVDDLRRAEDAYIDQLYDFLPANGTNILHANFPRSFVDVNRSADIRVKHGSDRPCMTQHWYRDKQYDLYLKGQEPDPHEIMYRIRGFYHPYHQQVKALLDDTYNLTGGYVFVDLHSMRSQVPVNKEKTKIEPNKYDLIIGTGGGTTADNHYVYALHGALIETGFEKERIGINQKFIGRQIAHDPVVSNPEDGRHAIQLELNRGLYMNEDTVATHEGFLRTKGMLRAAFMAFKKYVEKHPARRKANYAPVRVVRLTK